MTTYDNVAKLPLSRNAIKPHGTQEVLHQISYLSEAQLSVVAAFIRQILQCHDTDIVQTFVELQQDPQLGSLLAIASDLEDEERDQLLFIAEEMFRQQSIDRASA